MTKNIVSVDSQSFFDISNVFPVGGWSGAQVKITVTRRKPEVKRGSARVYQSRLLVEANRKCIKGKIEAPRR